MVDASEAHWAFFPAPPRTMPLRRSMCRPSAMQLAALALGLAMGIEEVAGDAPVRGSLFPHIDEKTWEGWEPSHDFMTEFGSWPDLDVPEAIEVWCKGFIPSNASDKVVGGMPVMPITGPFGIPIPGLIGQCAGIDGRTWSSAPPGGPRPTDARFWGRLEVAQGRGAEVSAIANCGMSHNVCCDPHGCWDGSKFGSITCSEHCPDSEMQVKRLACWTPEGTQNGTSWPTRGEKCRGGAVLAAKVYIQGRGGNPCGKVAGVKPPVASWDVGIAVFPTKRKVTLTGYVDDAPSYECYARAKDHGTWGPTVILAQVPMDMSLNIAFELAGYSDRPVNPQGLFFDLPLPSTETATVVV